MEIILTTPYKVYKNHRAEPYFTYLKNGEKTIEGRIREGEYQNIGAGDRIVVYNNEETDSVQVMVKNIRKYSSFKEMLENEQLKKILPDAETVEEGIKIYERFYGPKEEKEFGVVAMEVEVI
ncbi:MAG: ASCH domain-containing protein [Candidatus Paceibacterota bacterium]